MMTMNDGKSITATGLTRPPQFMWQRGFSLIELLIVVAIVGILAAIAYPSYQEQVRATRRADAQGALVAFAGAMERYYTQNGSYKGAASGGVDTGAPASTVFASEAPLDGGTKFYNLTISAADNNAFTLLATAKGAQTSDGNLRILSTGRKEWNKNGAGTWVPWTN